MNLRIRHVLPTAPSPTRQILTFIFWRSIGIPRGGSSLAHVSGYKLVAAVPDGLAEGVERLVHAGTGFRGREELRRAVDRPHPGEFFLTDDQPFGQVHLVP